MIRGRKAGVSRGRVLGILWEHHPRLSSSPGWDPPAMTRGHCGFVTPWEPLPPLGWFLERFWDRGGGERRELWTMGL